MRTMSFTVVAAAAVMISGCGGSGGGDPVNPGDVQFSEVQAVLDGQCTGCHVEFHGADTRENMLTMTTTCYDPVTAEVTERPVVKPGDPPGSALWHKLANVDLNCGREMPPFGTGGLIAISPADFDLVERWIEQGAGE